jgi:dihydropteroate synthase
MLTNPATLTCGRFVLSLSEPIVMGIVNVTPDSFQNEGRHLDVDKAIAHAKQLITEGAHMLDIGAESTRPGAAPVAIQDELSRLIPVVEALLKEDIALSIDTRHPEVMRHMVGMGVDMINDVQGFATEQARRAVASAHQPVAICAMHMQGEPLTMQQAPTYRRVVAEVGDFFYLKHKVLLNSGVQAGRIVFDPGIGFGKTTEHNIELIKGINNLQARLTSPVAWLIGLSRKSLIGSVTGKAAHERLAGSVVGAVAAVTHGAHIVRVHDVGATIDALKVWQALA